MAGQGTTGTGQKSEATQSFFVFVRDNSTGQIKSVVVPGDVQVGLDGNPADLTLLGRLAVAAKNYDVTFANKGILQTSPDDTIIGVSLVTTPMSGRISLYLSQNPREGELHFVKDLTATSNTVPIDIYPTTGYSIDGRASVTLNDPTASLALVFLNGNWYRLVAGLGTSGGSGADPLAEYVLLAGDGGLPNSRTLQVASNITMTDTGPAGTITLDLSHILGAGAGTYTYATVTADSYGRITGIANGATPPPANASYITALAEPALSNRRLLTGTRGVFATDGGAASTMGLSIDPSYFIGQGNVQVFIQSGNLVISGSNSATGFANAPAQAQYLLLQLTSALPQGRLVTPGKGMNVVDSGPNNNFTFNVNDNQVPFLTGATFTGPIKAPSITGTLGIVAQGLGTGGGFSGTLQTLADGKTRYLVGVGSVTVTTQSNGQVIISGSGGTPPVTNITGAGGTSVSSVGTLFTVSSSIGADDYASYLIASASSNQPPNARKLVAGSQVQLIDGGPGGNLTINVSASVNVSSSIYANLYAGYLQAAVDAENPNARLLTPGSNITFQDNGPGGTFIINSTGGGGGGSAPSSGMQVVTASLTSSVSITLHPNIVQLCTISSSWTDVAFWFKGSGLVAGANTIWLNLLVDGQVYKNLGTYAETVNNGAGWGSSFSGLVAGLAPGNHTYTVQATVGAANNPTIDPNLGGVAGGETVFYQGATLMLMNLSASVFNNYITGSFNGYNARYTSPDQFVMHQWRCLDSGSTTLLDNVDSAPMTVDNSITPASPILLAQTSLFDGAIRNQLNANSCYTTNNISEPPSASFTIDCWVESTHNGATSNSYIFGRQWKDPLDPTSFAAVSLASAGPGTLGYWMTLAGGAEAGGYSKFAYTADGEWHHIGLTFDGHFARLYLDGDEVFQEARVGNVDFSFAAPWFLSQFKNTAGTIRAYDGKICDARIHNVVRPPSYFRSVYQLGIGWASGSTFIASTQVTTTGSFVQSDANDVLWWPLHEVQGPIAFNFGTGGASGHLTASSNNVRFGQPGAIKTAVGVNINGTTNQYLVTNNLVTPPFPTASGSFTVSAWCWPFNYGSTTFNKIVHKSYFAAQNTWNSPFETLGICMFNNTTGEVEYFVTTSSLGGYAFTTTLSHSLGLNQWNHVGFTFDAPNGRFQCYLNGQLVGNVPITDPNAHADISQNGWWAVGGNVAIPTSEYFPGLVEDVRVAGVVRNAQWFGQVWASGRPDSNAALQLMLTGVALAGVGGSSFVASGAYSGPNAWVENGIAQPAPYPGATQIRTTSSVAIDSSGKVAGDIGTDVFFYVSGTIGQGPGFGRQATVFGGDVVVSGTLSASVATFPVLSSSNAALTGAITLMPNGNPLFVGIGGTGITTNSVGQIIISSSKGSGGSGVSGINVQNQGATLPASPYTTINFSGPGVTTSDVGGVATVTIPGAAAGNVPGSFASYYGYCTGSLLWNATGNWAPALGVPGNFTDGIGVNIFRNGSTFTVAQTGLYNFRSFFNTMAGANGTYIAFRLSGSFGTIISRTTFATDNPQDAILEGLMQLSSGSSFVLQYLTSGSAEQTWTPSDPNGQGIDTQNMRTGEVSIFLVPSGSATVNNYAITASVGNTAFSPANYAMATNINSFYFDTGIAGFQLVPNTLLTITSSGSPVLIMAQASWVAMTAGAQAFFSLARDGVNVGAGNGGLQGAGPTTISYNNNASFAYVDFGNPGGVHTYQLMARAAVGAGELGAWDVGPTALMAFEMKGANVVTSSTTLSQAVPGGNLIGLSASINPHKNPVLVIVSSNMSSDVGGNWCWYDVTRNGSSLANGASQGLSVNVGSNTNEIQGNNIVLLDQGPTIGSTNTYVVRATNGGGTNHVNFGNSLSSLILWEISDVNYRTNFDTTQRTPSAFPTFSDVAPTSPTQGLVTRGRPVLLCGTVNSNTSGGGGRNGYSFFRNGSNVVTSSKGLQLADGEGNNDWNKMPTMFWIDQVPVNNAGFYTYQLVGTVVSSSAFTAQGSYTYFFAYELDPGGAGVIIDGWFDEGNFLFTTSSIQALGNATFGNTTVTQINQTNPAALNVFSGSVTILGTLTFFSGSGMAITGSSVSRQYNIPFLSAMVTSPQFSGSKANLGVHWYDPTKFNTGIDPVKYIFRSVFAPVFGNGNAYVDLYDYNGIINGTPGPVSGSVLTASLPSQLTRQELDISTVMSGVTTPGILLARAWVDPSGSNFVNVGGTELVVEWR